MEEPEKSQVDFTSLEKKVFLQKGTSIYIGGELVNDQLRSVLHDEAKNLQTTHLFEIINATIVNEAFNLAMQAGTLEHIQYAKALSYWNTILNKLVNGLAK